MLEPGAIVDAIGELRERDPRPLHVFWVWAPTGDRDAIARNVQRRRGPLAIVPHVLRKVGFDDPNAVMHDVADVLDRVREDVLALQEAARVRCGVDLVIVSRRELRLVDTSSPINLPDWFPIAPETTPTVRIDDLTWSAAVALTHEASGLDGLRRLLHELDRTLLARLQASLRQDRRRVQGLWDLVFRESSPPPDRKVDDELQRIGRTLDAIMNPTGFRPSASRDPTVVGRLWAYANRTSPDGLPRAAKALAKAIGLDDESIGIAESLAAVLNRPSNPKAIADADVRWCLGLIVTLRTACQLVTAAAHADDYPRFSVVLLESTSMDLRRYLDRAIATLRVS